MTKINLNDYGFRPIETNDMPARVIATHRERYDLVCEHGEISAYLKTSIYYIEFPTEEYPTTGDFVLIQYNPIGESIIIKTLERKSEFIRSDGWSITGKQVIAANFDYVFIMASLNNDFNLKRIERYLTMAWQSRAVPVIILTKSDLIEDFTDKLRAVEKFAPGVGVYAVSAVTGYGIDMLGEYLKPGKTIVFLGSSGVGKSSLLNALAGEELMEVNVTRNVDASKGRHTTTYRQLIMLNSGVMIIDTPGMRELGMFDAGDGLSDVFSDIENYLGKCKFSDCKHQSEPGCAIKAAIESGELSAARWQRYSQLNNENNFSRRAKQIRNKNIAKFSRERKKFNKEDYS